MQVKSINKTIHSSQKPMSPKMGAVKAAKANMANKMAMSSKYQPKGKPAGAGKSNSVVMGGNSVQGKGTGYKSKKA